MMRFASLGVSLLAMMMLWAPSAIAEGGQPSTVSQPDAPEGLAVNRTVTLSEGLQQAAAGELSIVSVNATPSLDLASVTFSSLCVKNYRSTAASDVWVEGWVSDQVPQIGGDLTHVTVATYNVGLVQGLSTRCVSSGTVQLTPPNPGQYWKSVALYEGSGANRTLQFVYTDSAKWDVGGPFSGTGIYFETPAAHYFTNGGNNASLQVRRIANSSYGSTRQLRIGLWASSAILRYGYNLTGQAIATKEYPALPANSSSWNIDTGSMAVTQPPPGTYWITAVLWEMNASGYYNYTCIYTFPTQYTFTVNRAQFSGQIIAPHWCSGGAFQKCSAASLGG